MKSRYEEGTAADYVAAVRGVASETLALRTYTSRLLGAVPALVLHGGGNTSAKGRARDLYGEEIDVLYIKGSGWDLATIEPRGLPATRLDPLLKLRALDALSDEAMVNELRLALLDASAPTPSVEALLHAFLPARFIDHTHADAVLAVCDQPDGERICRAIYGEGLVWVPYVMPGFALAKRCAALFDAATRDGRSPRVIVLERHGIFTFGETAQASYEAMIDAVTRAERYIADARRTASVTGGRREAAVEGALLPRLRGVLARLAGEPLERGPVLALRSAEAVLSFLERPDAADLAATGCVTPDHVLRTKPTALFLAKPDFSDLDRLEERLEREIVQYASDYRAYFEAARDAKRVERAQLDPWPRALLVPGLGLVGVGRTRRDADVVGDVMEHALDVMSNAADIGRYAPVSRDDLFDVEYWSLEQAKIKKTARLPLDGAIAAVTGAASGIGLATASRLLDLGAHVAVIDRDAPLLEAARGALASTGERAARVAAIAADVTLDADVTRAILGVVEAFGGLDVAVSNAGSAPEGRLDADAGEAALVASLEINLLAHNRFAKAAVRVMKAQRRGGCLLFNASKSAFNPGPGFGPYAVAKAALVALMRQYAVDLGAEGVRANAVNADRVRTQLFAGGVAESRARARGVSVEAYFKSNLLGREVEARDVADAFAWLAQARATTGCVVTVDGGNAAAFPR